MVAISAFAADGFRNNAPDLFARENIHIEPGRVVGRLLVTGGNAIVGGTVEKGIVTVDGNLFLTSEAQIKGTVIVLGGTFQRDPGAKLEKMALTVAPGKVPVAGFLVGGLLLLGVASLAVIPVVAWFIARIVKRVPPSLWLKERLAVLDRHWAARYIVLVISVGVLMLTFFAEMAWETLFRHQMDFFDNLLIWLVRYLANPELDRAMIVISGYGYGIPFWTMILVVLLTLAYYRQWLEGTGLLICLIGEAILNYLLKNLFERSRPDLFQVVEEAGYSFPSGHAMVSLCFYGMITFLIARHIHSWRWRLAVITLALALVATIGLSRVYLGVHYPTDVIAGYFAGSAWLAFCISLLLWWERRGLGKRQK